MERKQIAPGAYVTELDASKFNRCRLTLHFTYPASRRLATPAAVLALCMERGYADYPDMTALSRRLAALYGAGLGVDTTRSGANRVLTVEVSGLRSEFALEGEDLTRAYTELLVGVAFRPYLVDGLISPEAVEIEKDTLARRLDAAVNDKRRYNTAQARRRFFGDHPAGVELDGYRDEVDAVTPAMVTEAYREILGTATVDLMVQGADAAVVSEQVAAALAGLHRQVLPPAPPAQIPAGEVQRLEERFPDLVQAKLCLLFTQKTPGAARNIEETRLAMSLFGGSVSSRLFLRVREQQSLCYYCAASAQTQEGYMIVDSGVEPANAKRAEEAILKEWQELITGPITEEELEDNRRALLSAFDAAEDSISGLEVWYFGQILRGEALRTPAKSRREMEAVTAEDVRRVLASYALSVSSLVTGEGE